MKKKQKATIKLLKSLLNNITLIDEKVDYLSYQSLDVCKNITAFEVYKMMTSYQPKWLVGLFKIRDFLGKSIGIKPINGFDNLAEKEPDIGSTVHFFTIIEKTRDTFTLIIRDFHLDVCLCLRIIETNDHKKKLYLITSVKIHNFWGRLYMVPVSIIHPYIVYKLFKNINSKK
ncbi:MULTISPECIES: DUF2867 domain-containing protein [unclassified Gilliamella]|uniref:DUF2867 domain-containing protein n=1 Tax=unclassified Gilliamella TaxID=2685620 RepID=UPI001C69FD7F|nr:DUF2867 domain-containing protein [Gilliamella sp. ESL0441]QYN43903.1 DUF2867 domain-containing protein [Gilliamella sp. ESL0441]